MNRLENRGTQTFLLHVWHQSSILTLNNTDKNTFCNQEMFCGLNCGFICRQMQVVVWRPIFQD